MQHSSDLSPSDMDDYTRFRELASSPFSSRSIRLLKAAVQIIRTRYPNCLGTLEPQYDFVFPPHHAFNIPSGSLTIDESWAAYARRISQRQEPREGDEITPSLWRLGRGDHLDTAVVESYLQLLRDRYSTIPILEPSALVANIEELVVRRDEKPTIVPLKDGEQWLFMVVYPDCIHFFDSRQNSLLPQCSALPITNWTGPKQSRPEDSGLFMLLGIRLIVEGAAHVDQSEAEAVITKFRSMVLVELLSMKLDPGPGDLEELLQRESYEDSRFFEEAAWGLRSPASTAEISRSAASLPPVASAQEAAARPNAALTPQSLPRPVHEPAIPPNDRKTILTVLGNAVAASRSTKMTAAAPLVLLWSCIKNDRWSSEFHRRYNGVLFYERMQHQGPGVLAEPHVTVEVPTLTEMRSLQPKFRFWKELCSLYPNQGPARYTLLSAIPEGFNVSRMSRDVQDAKIAEIRSRLSDENDRLRQDLAKAENLCKAILESSLPTETLMIDLYRYREQEDLTDEYYDAFVSLNPRERIRIPRLTL